MFMVYLTSIFMLMSTHNQVVNLLKLPTQINLLQPTAPCQGYVATACTVNHHFCSNRAVYKG